MSGLAIDVKLFGGPALIKGLESLSRPAQIGAMKAAEKVVAKRARSLIAKEIRRRGLKRTGAMVKAMAKAKITVKKGRFKGTVGVLWPTREEFGISSRAAGFYPVVHEYQAGGKGFRFIRDTIDDNAESLLGVMRDAMLKAVIGKFDAIEKRRKKSGRS